MIFLHGFASTPRAFDPIRARVGGVALAILGHGATSSAACFDEEVDRLAAQVPLASTLVGYSMGGRLALGIAARHPARVARLVLIAAHPGIESDAVRRARAAEDEARARALESGGLQTFLEAWDAMPMFARRTPPSREGLDAAGLARALRVLGPGVMTPRWETLSEHDVTFVVGALDAAYEAVADAVSRRAPNVRVVRVPDADHDVIGCAPDAVSALLGRGSEGSTEGSSEGPSDVGVPRGSSPDALDDSRFSS